jgi:membrane fusion protein (multidrug efflux system)
MPKRILIGIAVFLGLAAVIAALFWEKFPHQIGAMQSAPPPMQVEAVTTAKADQQTWNPTLNSVGTLTAENSVTLSAEVAGTIVRLEFESGAKVEKGALLAQLDVAVEEAQLRSAEARAELARLNAERVRELRKNQTVAQSDLDAAEAQFKGTIADVEALRAQIEKKTFRAPFTGRLGIRQISLGQFVNAGNPIVTLEALDPIHVDFALPQQRIADIAVGQDIRVSTDGVGDQVFTGRVTAIDPHVDPATRNVRVRGTLSNAGEKLRSGMFATVELVLPATAPVIVIRASSVLYAPYGNSVFIVEHKKDAKGAEQATARQQTVRLGVTRGDFVTVISGVLPGDEVVSTGAFKLRNGISVRVNNDIVVPAELAPKPANS